MINSRLGEALSDSEIEKNENTCSSRRSSSGTAGGSNNSSRKSLRTRVGLRRRHNSSSSDGSLLKHIPSLAPLTREACDTTIHNRNQSNIVPGRKGILLVIITANHA